MHPFKSCRKMFLHTKGPGIKVTVFAEFPACLYCTELCLKERTFFYSLDKDFTCLYCTELCLTLSARLSTLVTKDNTNYRGSSKYSAPKGLKNARCFILEIRILRDVIIVLNTQRSKLITTHELQTTLIMFSRRHNLQGQCWPALDYSVQIISSF